jgi:hypothetical protein
LAFAGAILWSGASPAPQAQILPSLQFGTSVVMHSKVLNEDRRLNVYVPPDYAKGAAKFPVIYLLDGSATEDYFHAASLFDFLATYGVMPPSIVVGVANVDRQRDFTRPSRSAEDRKAAPTSGGADAFVKFVSDDLEPYVDAHYRTSGHRTIVGQSLGGLVAAQVLLERPELFDDYVIVSPSLWWDTEALLKSAPASLHAHHANGRRVYLSVADEPSEMKTDAEALVGDMKQLRPDIKVFYEYLPHETHATSLHISLYDAMHLLNPPVAKK